LVSESIERFIENQDFLRSYDSAPRPPPPIHLCRRYVGPATHRKIEKERQLADGSGRREGCGRGAESNDLKKVWPSVNHSVLSLRYHRSQCRCCSVWRAYFAYLAKQCWGSVTFWCGSGSADPDPRIRTSD